MLFFHTHDPLQELPGIPLDPDCLDILPSAAAFRQRLLELIAGARQRIHIAALYLQADHGGTQVLDALYRAAAANPSLDIKLFVDAHRARRGLIGQAKQEGNAAWYRSRSQAQPLANLAIYGVPVQNRELFGVMHLKGFVIDDTVLYSGASLNDVYLHVGERYRFDRYHQIHNPTLADSLSHYLCSTLATAPAVLRLDRPLLQDKPQHRRQIKLLRRQLGHSRYQLPGSSVPDKPSIHPIVGLGRNNRFNAVLLQLLRTARQQLTICTPYFNLPRPVMVQLDAALARGVRVELIIGDKTANDFYIPPEEPFKVIGCLPYLYEMNLRRFARKRQATIDRGQLNIRLWRHDRHSYHLKGLWLDHDYQLITGNNLNPRAFSLDLENGLLIHDPQQQLWSKAEQELRDIRQHTQPLQHYRQLQKLADYPERVRKLLTRLGRLRLDRLFNRLL